MSSNGHCAKCPTLVASGLRNGTTTARTTTSRTTSSLPGPLIWPPRPPGPGQGLVV